MRVSILDSCMKFLFLFFWSYFGFSFAKFAFSSICFSLVRFRYVLGHEAMRRLGSSAVLVAGMGGLGVEIAKNVTLAGVGQLVLQDTRHATIEDLSTNFFLTDRDVKEKRNRAEAVLPHISSLNNYVRVSANTSPLTKELLKNCSVSFYLLLVSSFLSYLSLQATTFIIKLNLGKS